VWGARLHEIGLVISHSSFHKHGAYILANADLPGFSREQQAVLAALVRVHRRKFVATGFDDLPELSRDYARRLALLLRISVLMHRGRSGSHKPPMRIRAAAATIELEFPQDWLDEHPLTEAEISREAEWLSNAGFTLQYA
jgi:exopolyphosphatase/guanosine-5'-triphosphate,3'-diphosphate pyrophosphatase